MRQWLLVLVGLALVATQGCGVEVRGSNESGGTKKEGPLELAVVPKAVGFAFWEQVQKGAKCAVSKHENVTMQWNGVTKETNVTGQVNLLQNYITQGVDGLVYAATDAKVLAQVTKSARQNNITVVNIDSGTTPQPKNVPVFATDNVTAARKAAGMLAENLGGGKHKIAAIQFQPGTSTNDQRMKGFKQGLKKHPNLNLVAQQSSQSSYNKALSVTENILTAHPDIEGIFAANEPSVLGAAEAVRQAGKAGEIEIIGWDAAPDEIEALKEGVISALVVQNPFRMGYAGVNAAIKEIRTGKEVPGGDTGVTMVTRKNLQTPEVQRVLHPSCANPPTG